MTNILKPFVSFIGYALGFYCFAVIGFTLKYIMEVWCSVFCKAVEDVTPLVPYIICAAASIVVHETLKLKWKYNGSNKPRKCNIISPFGHEMVTSFEDLVEQITPSESYLREGRAAANAIFEALKKPNPNQNFKIGKTKIAGSFSKHTGVMYTTKDGKDYKPDLDLVVFLNDSMPPFQETYMKFKEVLEKMPCIRNIKVKHHSMKFYVATETQGLIKVDLLAAHNHVQSNPDPGSRQWMDVAQEEADRARVLLNELQSQEIQASGTVSMEHNYLHSASFALCTVKVIDFYVSDPFVLKIVQLAKYWSSKVMVPKGENMFPPRSCMIEVIAISTQRKKYGRQRNQCIISGFRRFLKAMSGLAELDVRLTDINTSADRLPWNYSTPMVVDPVNHFNNLAHGLHPVVINMFVQQADDTLALLDRLGKGAKYQNENAIDKIFSHKE